MQTYLAVIGDIIDSKKIKNRGEIQFEMKKTFQVLNQKYSDLIVSKFTLTIGDEFQALLKPARGVWQLLDLLTVRSSAPFRLGLGYGEIRTQIDPDQSLGADGEAFWRARMPSRQCMCKIGTGAATCFSKGDTTSRMPS